MHSFWERSTWASCFLVLLSLSYFYWPMKRFKKCIYLLLVQAEHCRLFWAICFPTEMETAQGLRIVLDLKIGPLELNTCRSTQSKCITACLPLGPHLQWAKTGIKVSGPRATPWGSRSTKWWWPKHPTYVLLGSTETMLFSPSLPHMVLPPKVKAGACWSAAWFHIYGMKHGSWVEWCRQTSLCYHKRTLPP